MRRCPELQILNCNKVGRGEDQGVRGPHDSPTPLGVRGVRVVSSQIRAAARPSAAEYAQPAWRDEQPHPPTGRPLVQAQTPPAQHSTLKVRRISFGASRHLLRIVLVMLPVCLPA